MQDLRARLRSLPVVTRRLVKFAGERTGTIAVAVAAAAVIAGAVAGPAGAED